MDWQSYEDEELEMGTPAFLLGFRVQGLGFIAIRRMGFAVISSSAFAIILWLLVLLVVLS